MQYRELWPDRYFSGVKEFYVLETQQLLHTMRGKVTGMTEPVSDASSRNKHSDLHCVCIGFHVRGVMALNSIQLPCVYGCPAAYL